MKTALVVLALAPATLAGQSKYPTPPRSLGEATEIALALTAAPAEISANADVYVLRGTDFVKARAGTNGCACVVGRDSHDGSRYPICFDREGARTTLFRELMEGSLRARGNSEARVKALVDAAYKSAELQLPAKSSVAYMMSPQQVLFSTPDADGVRVGAWSPHIMLMLPGVMPEQLGLAHDSKVDVIQIHDRGGSHSELVVKVPKWSDGSPASK
jgi:hypothetical protein